MTRSIATEFQNLNAASARLQGLRREDASTRAKVEALRLISQAVDSNEAREEQARQEQQKARIGDRLSIQEISVERAKKKLLSLAGCLLQEEGSMS
ncbi:MAG: hypothetical protein HY535_04610 [Chloroflexi bacterium]|nr:hypothetical protein [Chloroflexota bacterium]